jgi:hypothetical protein
MTRLSYSCGDLDKDHMRMTYMQVRKVDHAQNKYEFAWKFMEFNFGRSSGACSMQSLLLGTMFHNIDMKDGAA